MSAPAHDFGGGFTDPGTDAQRVFRLVLEAMSRPGRIVSLPALAAPPSMSPAAGSTLLALADFETPVWLGAEVRDAAPWLRFETGSPIVDQPGDAVFAVARADAPPPLGSLPLGSDEYPDCGATLILEVRRLGDAGPLRLAGPGIAVAQRLGVEGVAEAFWRQRAGLADIFPRGVDLVLTSGCRLAAIPRTTVVES